MTAVNAIASGSRGRIVTDGATYAPDGAVVGFVTKAVALPHLGMAFASRGATAARWALAEVFEAFESFDGIVAGAASALEEAHGYGELGEDLDVVLMGWSTARRRVELHALSTIAHGAAPPFTLQAMAVTLAPMPDDDALRRIGLKLGATFDLARPAEKLRQVIQIQRDMLAPFPGAGPDAPPGHTVGGPVVLTEVSEAGIAQQVLHRWPDEIGRALAPESDAPAPPRTPQLRIVS